MTATNNYKDTIVVVYPPGGYGTFVEWCLNYFTGLMPVGPNYWPFVAHNGSSHRFRGNQITPQKHVLVPQEGFNNFDEFLSNDRTVRFARTHAYNYTSVTGKTDYVQEAITTHHANLNRFVYVRPCPNTILLLLNNMAEKIFKAPGVVTASKKYVTSNMDTWEIRELISFWFDEFQGWINPYYSVTDHCVIIELHDLIADLESALDKIFTATGLQWSVEHRADIGAVTQRWLSLQRHLNKDTVCQAIVNSIINSTHYDWHDQKLTMYDEAFVQWALRDLHGLHMKCYNVNVFPTNTTDLRNLLINE